MEEEMQRNNQALLKDIETMFNQNIQSLDTKMQGHVSSINNNMVELERNINGNIDQKFQVMNNKVETLHAENQELKETLEKQNNRIETLESKDKGIDRSVNIVIYGVKDQYYHGVLNKIIQTVRGIEVDITKYCVKGIFKIGRKKWNEDGPVRVSFISNILRNDIMRNKHKLKNNQNGIYIREDLSESDRNTRSKLLTYSLEAKTQGKKVFMKNDKLVIDGKTWSLQELEELSNRNENDGMDIDKGEPSNSATKDTGNTPGNPRKRGAPLSPFGPSVYKESINQSAKKGKTDKTKKQVDNGQQKLQELWMKQTEQITQVTTQSNNDETQNDGTTEQK